MMIDKIDIAKSRLMLDSPYFGNIASMLSIEFSDDIPTFRCDSQKIWINRSYLDELEVSEIETILSNSAMKKVLYHEDRGRRKHPKIWNLATEYAINSMLKANGFELPKLSFYDEQYDGMYAEQIYRELLESMNIDDEIEDDNESQESNSQQQFNPMLLSKAQEKLEKAMLESIFLKAKNENSLPEELDRVVPSYFSHKINWQELLRRYINQLLKSSYRYLPSNYKHLYRGIALPSLHSQTLDIAVAIDVSGSIDDKTLSLFLSELQNLIYQFDDYKIELITIDHKIRSHTTIYPGEEIEYDKRGGGSTDFRVLFEYIDRYIPNINALIFFSDANGIFPKSEPNFDTLWILNTPNSDIPFGEKIVIGQD